MKAKDEEHSFTSASSLNKIGRVATTGSDTVVEPVAHALTNRHHITNTLPPIDTLAMTDAGSSVRVDQSRYARLLAYESMKEASRSCPTLVNPAYHQIAILARQQVPFPPMTTDIASAGRMIHPMEMDLMMKTILRPIHRRF